MEMDIEVQKTARRWHSIHEYTPNYIKLLLKWEFLQSQLALTNICPPFSIFQLPKNPH